MRLLLIGMAFVALSGCSKGPRQAGGPGQAPDQAPAAAADKPGGAPIAVSVPQMAYTYKYTFRLDGAAIPKAQQRAIALCERLGPARCQVLGMEAASSDGAGATGTLKLRVAAAIARQIGARLQNEVAGAGGRALSSSIAAEDVSKDISDTEARLKQRELLVQRLTEILATRKGSVGDLVEAERGVAAAQEEIDQARAWLAELRGRVAMSTIEVSYEAVTADAGGAGSGVGDSLKQSWSMFLYGLAALLQAAIVLLPWALLGGAIFWAVRAARRRRSARGHVIAPYPGPPYSPPVDPGAA